MAVTEAPKIRDHATRAWRASARVGAREIVVVVIAFVIYFAIRGMVVGRAGEAMVRGFNVIELEQRLGIYWELAMQSWIIDHFWLIKVANWIYFWGHMPLVIVSAVWLYAGHRPTYMLVRNSFLASGAIGVIIYWAFPVAPPRLIPFAGFIDTMAVFDRVGYNAQETKAFVNEFAAIPSLHFGWSMLLGFAIFWVTKKPALKVFGLVWPVAMFFAVVLTANHFIIDAVFGAIVSFAGLGIAWLLHRYGGDAWTRIAGRVKPSAAELLAKIDWDSTEYEELTQEEASEVVASQAEYARGESVNGDGALRNGEQRRKHESEHVALRQNR